MSQWILKEGGQSIVQGDFSLVLFKFVKQSQTLLTCLQHATLLYCIVAFSLLHAALFEVFTLSLHIYSEHSRRQAACGLKLLLIISQTGSVALASLHPHPSPPLTDPPVHSHQLVTAQCPPQAGEGASYAPTAPGHNNPTVIRNCMSMNGLFFQCSNSKMHSVRSAGSCLKH